MEEIELIEYEFQVREIDIEIQGIESQIARLQLEKDKFNHQKILLAESFRQYINSNIQSGETETQEESISEIEEIKPRRLKK